MAKRASASVAYREALQELAPAEHLARLVIRKRTELGLSQKELADRMGISAPAISRLESGTHRVSLATLQKVAAAIDQRVVVGFAGESELEKATHADATPRLAAV